MHTQARGQSPAVKLHFDREILDTPFSLKSQEESFREAALVSIKQLRGHCFDQPADTID